VINEPRRHELPPSQPFTKGLVEVFTGNGKGKTSAAFGVVLRALGHGLRVCIIYFMKGDYPYGEQKVLSQLPNVSFMRFGQMSFVDPLNIKEEEKQQASEALKAAREAMLSGENDVVVLDEVNVASAWGLVKVEDVMNLIREKPEGVELILTGRYADARLIELGDVVTEMVEVKHPYRKGLLSRAGIDY
jgi:cob(I)alamin adenosyltransferase